MAFALLALLSVLNAPTAAVPAIPSTERLIHRDLMANIAPRRPTHPHRNVARRASLSPATDVAPPKSSTVRGPSLGIHLSTAVGALFLGAASWPLLDRWRRSSDTPSHGDPEGWPVSGRGLLDRRSAVATALLGSLAVRQSAWALPTAATYSSPSTLFTLTLPSGWSIQYDRSAGMVGSGVLAVVTSPGATSETGGKFVLRRTSAQELALPPEAPLTVRALLSALVTEAVQSPAVSGVEVSQVTTGATPSGAVTLEYVLATCFGRSEEGSRGSVLCTDGRNQPLPRVVRHYRVVAQQSGDGVLLGVGSTVPRDWSALAADIDDMASSLSGAAR